MTASGAQFAQTTSASDDLELVHAVQNGDISAFAQLVARYDGKLLRIAQHITHNREDSEDAVQDAFLKAFQHLGDFREDSQFSTWLIRITVNQALMRLRKRRTIKEVSLDDDFEGDEGMLPREAADWAPNPEELYRASELRDILIKTLEELRPVLRTVFVLRDIEGLSIAQTAEVLSLTPSAVKARLWRARLDIRGLLSKYFNMHKEPNRAGLGPRRSILRDRFRMDIRAECSSFLKGKAGRDLKRADQCGAQGLGSASRSGEDRSRAAAGHLG
jgi:RNA polymerase sigma-70 factor, ECF subfamily